MSSLSWLGYLFIRYTDFLHELTNVMTGVLHATFESGLIITDLLVWLDPCVICTKLQMINIFLNCLSSYLFVVWSVYYSEVLLVVVLDLNCYHYWFMLAKLCVVLAYKDKHYELELELHDRVQGCLIMPSAWVWLVV